VLFDILQESSNFILEIVTLVSSSNIMGSDKVFIAGGISFMYNMKVLSAETGT
jgi:hypothetical protein